MGNYTAHFHANGLPHVLSTDNGSEFKNKLNAEAVGDKTVPNHTLPSTLPNHTLPSTLPNHTLPSTGTHIKINFVSSAYLFGLCVQSNGLDERFNQTLLVRAITGQKEL